MCKRVLVSRLLCVSPQAILSGAPVSLPPAELPPSYFHASQSIHACPVLLSRSLQQSSPQAISTLHSPSRLPGAPVSLPPAEILPSYFQAISKLSTPSALVPSFLPCSSGYSVSLPSRRRNLNENPSIGDAFGKNGMEVCTQGVTTSNKILGCQPTKSK